MKKCLISLALKEIQIKTTLKFHLTAVRIEWLPSKTQTTNVGEDVGKKESSHIARWNVN
jgi:hypothetical protein